MKSYFSSLELQAGVVALSSGLQASSLLSLCPSEGALSSSTGKIPCLHFIHWKVCVGEEEAYFYFSMDWKLHITSIPIPLARTQSHRNTWLRWGLGNVVFIPGSHVGQLKFLLPWEKGRMHFMIPLAASAIPFNYDNIDY